MYPNLLGQKEARGLGDRDMALIIGVSQRVYRKKIRDGTFTLSECAAYCSYFEKPFDFLFISTAELDTLFRSLRHSV